MGEVRNHHVSPAFPFPHCVASDKPLTFSVPPFPFQTHTSLGVAECLWSSEREGSRDPGGEATISEISALKPVPPAHPQGTHVLQLEFPLGPLILRLLGQEVDGDVTTDDQGRFCRPVTLTQHLGPEGWRGEGRLWVQPCHCCPLLYPVPPLPTHLSGPCHSAGILLFVIPSSKAPSSRSHFPSPGLRQPRPQTSHDPQDSESAARLLCQTGQPLFSSHWPWAH